MPTEKQKFIDWVNKEFEINIRHEGDLSLLKTNDKATYWKAIWENYNVKTEENYSEVLSKDGKWFIGSKLNYAGHIFRKKNTDQAAINFNSEAFQDIPISWQELETQTASFADYLRYHKVQKGDIVAGVLGNIPEQLYAFLACNSIGAIWANLSPMLETNSLINHFQQLEPKVLVTNEMVEHNGKDYNLVEKINELADNLPHLKQIVVVPSQNFPEDEAKILKGKYWNDTFSMAAPSLTFEPLPFDFPLYLSFSNKKSGLPEPKAYPQGGVLLAQFESVGLQNGVIWSDLVREEEVLGAPLLLGATVEFFEGSKETDTFSCLKGMELKTFMKEKRANYPDLGKSFFFTEKTAK